MTDRTSLAPIPPRPAPPEYGWRTTLRLLQRLPQGAVSRAVGRLADTPLPLWLRRPILSTFARSVGIDVSEAQLPLEAYPTVNAFFVRRLRPGARPIATEDGLVSPVDGIIGQIGTIRDGRAIQAKGMGYGTAELLGSPEEAARFEGGSFITIYLSPRHYHRIHAPVSGLVESARYVPGALLPVNGPSVRHVPALFPRNERLLAYLEGGCGRVALVAVGAFNVGRISAAFDPAWSGEGGGSITNRRDPLPTERRYAPPVPVERGEEFMAFHLGSTVVLLTEPARLELLDRCRPGREVTLGTLLAR